MCLRSERLPFGLVWLAIAGCLPGALGQSLSVPRQTAVVGQWAILEIAFQAPAGREFVALQWEIEIPSGSVELEGAPLTRVPLAVKDAGKSVTCGVSRKTTEGLLMPCILAGSQKPLPNGTIVLLSLKISERTRPGAARIQLRNGIALTPDLKQAPIEPAEGAVTIQAR